LARDGGLSQLAAASTTAAAVAFLILFTVQAAEGARPGPDWLADTARGATALLTDGLPPGGIVVTLGLRN
jgi:hypothetical protein